MRTRKVIPMTILSDTLNQALNTYKKEVLDDLNKTQRVDGIKGKKKAETQYKAHAIKPKEVMKKKYRDGRPRDIPYVDLFYTSKIGYLKQKVSNKEYRLTHLLNDGHMSANQYGKNYTVKKSEKGYGGLPRSKTTSLIYWTETTKYLETEYPKDMLETLKKHDELKF